MINLLPTLISLMGKPKTKTKKEKFLNWFSKHNDECLFSLWFINLIVAYFIFPFAKPIVYQGNGIIPMDFIDFCAVYFASYLPGFFSIYFGMFLLNNIIKHKKNDQVFEQQDRISNYLKDNQNNEDMKEFLIKIKLINFYHALPSSYKGYTDNLIHYLNIIDNNHITEKVFDDATQVINNHFLSFLEKERKLLEMPIENLKIMIKKHISLKLKEEKDVMEKAQSFINDFSNEKDLFQKEKSLKANL